MIPERARAPRRIAPLELVRDHPWVSGTIGLLLLSTLIVVWARVRPGYDPYGWLVWGHLTVHFKLDTNGAPSWKPLPYLFDLPFSVIGHYALWLWMITSVAISLSGVVFAWRIAFRLVEAEPRRRYAAYAAGLVAGAAVLGIRDYTHFILSVQSDTMIVSLCLGAVDCWLSGRQRWALALWVLAALGRPEVWPFMGVYCLWLWRAMPSMRRLIVGGILVLPLFWFGVPALTAKSAFIAGSNALHSVRELTHNKFFGTIDRFFDLHELPVQLAALLAVVLAIRRRQRTILILAAGAVAWVLIEGGFALHGWPAVPRYLFEPVAITGVLAGVAIGRVILDVPPYLARTLPRLMPHRLGPAFATRLGNWGVIAVLVLFVGAMLPPAASRLRIERVDLKHERLRATQLNRLAATINRLGAAHIVACGQPHVRVGYQSALAWYMGNVNVGQLYWDATYLRLHPYTSVDIFPLRDGWRVTPTNVTADKAAACSGLRVTYRS